MMNYRLVFAKLTWFLFLESYTQLAWGEGANILKLPGLTCTVESPNGCDPNPDLQKKICELKRSNCKALNQKSGGELSKEEYLIDCDRPTQCLVIDASSMIEGCKTLGGKKLTQIGQAMTRLNTKIGEIDRVCRESSAELNIKNKSAKQKYIECLAQYLPSVKLPANLDFLFNALGNASQKVGNWFLNTSNHIRDSLVKDCGHLKNKSSPDYARCYFKISLGAMLESLEEPYAKSPLKATTDRISQLYVATLAEHLQKKGCYNEAGASLEFCGLLASLAVETAELALDLKDFIPNPVGGARKLAQLGDLDEIIKGKMDDLTESNYKEMHEIIDLYHPPVKNTKGTAARPAGVSALVAATAKSLDNFRREGLDIDWDSKDAVSIDKGKKLLRKIAIVYQNLYKNSGYVVNRLEIPPSVEYPHGTFKIVIESSADKKKQKLLTGIREKQEVKELFINIDENFIFTNGETAGFYPGSRGIDKDAFGSHNPESFVRNPFFFHEVHHAYYEKSKYQRKDLPYYGQVRFSDPQHSLVTLENYLQVFDADEVAAYKKNVTASKALIKAKDPGTLNVKSNMEFSDERYKNHVSFALAYRESSRSLLRITSNINSNFDKTYKSNELQKDFNSMIKYNIRGKGEREPSSAVIPILDSSNNQIGEFKVTLIGLDANNQNKKIEVLKNYLQKMQDAALVDFKKAQQHIDELKSGPNN